MSPRDVSRTTYDSTTEDPDGETEKEKKKKKKSTGRVRRDRVLFGARLESFGVSLFRLIDTGCVGIRTAKRQPGSCLSRNALTRFPGKIQRFVDLSRERGRNVGGPDHRCADV